MHGHPGTRCVARLGSAMAVCGLARFSSSLAVLDVVHIGSSLSLRSVKRMGSALSVVGLCRSAGFKILESRNFWHEDNGLGERASCQLL